MADKRAYPRTPITLDVAVTIEGKQSFFCIMKDFCFGGIYLLFNTNIAPAATQRNQIQLNSNLSIDFNSPLDPTGESHRLQGRVARLDDEGIGIAFTTQNIRALQALQQLAGSAGQQPDNGEPARESNVKYRAIANSVKEKLTGFTSELIEQLINECDESLFLKASEARTNAEQTAFFDAINELKAGREKIIEDFNGRITRKLQAFSEKVEDDDDDEQQQGATPGLSLVGKEDFNDWLLATSIISRLENHFKDPLLEVEKRFDAIAVTPIDNKNNPAGPYALCHSFQHVLSDIKFDSEPEELIYQLLEKELRNRLDDLYNELNTLLIENDIIPNIEDIYRVASAPSGAPAAPMPGMPGEMEGAAEEMVEPLPEGYPPEQPGMAPQTPYPQGAAPGMPQGVPQGAPAAQMAPATWGAPPAAGPSAFEQPRLAATGLNAVQDLMTMAPQPAMGGIAPTGVAPATAGAPVTYYQPNDLLSVLSQLGAQNRNATALRAEGTDIYSYLMSQLQAQNRDSAVPMAIDERQGESLQFMGSLLNFFQTDALISELSKRWVGQLEVPLLKASIIDPSILYDKTHAAHQVVNLIDELGNTLPPDDEAYREEVKGLLDRTVTRINDEVDTNHEVFADVLPDLEEQHDRQHDEYQKNLAEVVKECEEQQQLFQSRAHVIDDLNLRIGDREVPRLVVELLDAGWKNLILRTFLHKGGESEVYQNHLNVIDQIYARLSGNEPYSASALISDKAITGWVSRILAKVAKDKEKSETLLKTLEGYLSQEDPAKGVQKGFIPKLPSITFHAQKSGVAMQPEKLTREEWYGWLDRTDTLKKNDVVKYTADDDTTRLLKLAFVDRPFSYYVLVDPSGNKALEMNLSEMALALYQERLSPIAELDAPIVERATFNLLDDLHFQFSEQASHDELTSLLNRRSFEKLMIDLLEKIVKEKSKYICCYFDLDRFNIINNTCGYEAGDTLLLQSSVLLKGVFENETAHFARMGDDEFAVVVENCSRTRGLELAAQAQESFHNLSFTCDDKDFSITASIGVVEIDEETGTVNNLLTAAESACFAAKEAGRDNVQIYNPDNYALSRRQNIMSWVGRINILFDAGLIKLRCQRITPLRELVHSKPHYEILLDVYDEEGNKVPLDEFIVAAEQYNRISDIDNWVVDQVFAWLSEHHKKMAETINSFSINLSGRSLNDRKFMESLHERLEAHDFPASMICFEITETIAITNLDSAAYFMSRLKETGCRFSLDDFGSGISSYTYLKSLPVDYLKIDGMFVQELATNTNDFAVIKSINEIAHVMGMETIAEYAENEILVQILRDIGLDYAQGYGVEKPRPLDSLIN